MDERVFSCTQKRFLVAFQPTFNAYSCILQKKRKGKKKSGNEHMCMVLMSPCSEGGDFSPLLSLICHVFENGGTWHGTQRHPNVWLNCASPPFRLTSPMALWCSEHTAEPKDPEYQGDKLTDGVLILPPFPNNSPVVPGKNHYQWRYSRAEIAKGTRAAV